MLAVTGIGMVSVLGLDATTSCAAARAGMTRVTGVDDVRVYDEEAQAPVPIAVHRVPILSEGLFGIARHLQLAIFAVDDLRRTSGASSDRPVGVVLVLGSEQHRTAWLDRLQRDPALSDDDADPASAERELTMHKRQLAEALLPHLVERAHIMAKPGAQRTILGDQVGFIAALEQAAEWLANGTCETCWVGGVDSYLAPATLQALEGLGLLRTPSTPVGLMPGELACFLSLETPGRQQGEALAVINSFAQCDGAASRLNSETPNAKPLMQAMLTAGGAGGIDLGVVNLNGDTARSSEWGSALVGRRLRGHADRTPTWVPPLSFGEIGAATGPASIALLARGWARGYAPASSALVCLMEDGASRGALSVSSP